MAHHFFLPEKIDPGGPVTLEGENAHHARNVLRVRKGDSITLADSTGQGYTAAVVAVQKERVVVRVKALLASPEPRVKVTLYQGWPKGDKLDFTIEKSTELGVDRIEVVVTERSIPRPHQGAIGRRRERWQQKALAAARQCRRHLVPVVSGPQELPAALNAIQPDTLLLVPWEGECTRSLKSVMETVMEKQKLAVLIGPEGGLSPAEIDLARSHGGIPITLGPRILRTETAGLVCLAAIMYALGELG